MAELDLVHRAHLVMLFDLYGGLLTEKQQTMFDLYHQCDLSLGEVAEEQGVSRQAVFDNIKRTEAALEEYEKKLHLAEKEYKRKQAMEQLTAQLAQQGVLTENKQLLKELGWEE
ncbi:MAG: YlxM family DNA-binding protein [Peptococcaceae bacterium]|nr:YlxM family DNA-binding protein [Peptococcaceae bacterium]